MWLGVGELQKAKEKLYFACDSILVLSHSDVGWEEKNLKNITGKSK